MEYGVIPHGWKLVEVANHDDVDPAKGSMGAERLDVAKVQINSLEQLRGYEAHTRR